jgi:diguanylate cyclase (GGDEF)-like protein/PAS domain S-box-containing protein
MSATQFAWNGTIGDSSASHGDGAAVSFETVLMSLDTGVVVLDSCGHAQWANPAVLRMLGIQLDDLLGHGVGRLRLYDSDGRPLSAGEGPIWETLFGGGAVAGRVVGVNRRDGRRIWVSLSCCPLGTTCGQPATLVSFTNVTSQYTANERLSHQANHDPLTGLPNRAHALARMSEALTFGGENALSAVMFIDLDDLKGINDSLGHEAGDQMIKIAAQRLQHAMRSDDVVARLGGDEFVALLVGPISSAGLYHLSDRLHTALAQPVQIGSDTVQLGASVGIAMVQEEDPRDAAQILHDADLAMYQAKATGRGRTHHFTEELRKVA